MIRKVWYMILVLVTIYLEIMYDSTWMLAMLAFELLLAAVMFLMSWYLKLHIRVWLDMKVPVSAKKQTFETAECCRYLLYIPFWNVRTAAADAVKKGLWMRVWRQKRKKR